MNKGARTKAKLENMKNRRGEREREKKGKGEKVRDVERERACMCAPVAP